MVRVGVQKYLEVGDVLQVVAVTFAEMRGQDAVALPAKLEPTCVNATVAQRQERSNGRHWRGRAVITPWAGFNQGLSAPEVGLEFLDSERPAGVRHPCALFEIDRIERAAPAAPMIGASSQIAHARCVERQIGNAADLAGVERLGLRVEVQTAA